MKAVETPLAAYVGQSPMVQWYIVLETAINYFILNYAKLKVCVCVCVCDRVSVCKCVGVSERMHAWVSGWLRDRTSETEWVVETSERVNERMSVRMSGCVSGWVRKWRYEKQ
jgi:hypothetical protein